MHDEHTQRWEGLFRGSVLSAALSKHVAYLTSADTRAQGLILLNSALVTVALSGLASEELRSASLLCALTALITVTLCIFCLYPKRLSSAKGSKNVLHYATFSRMPESVFAEHMQGLFADKEKLAQAAVHDLYHLGKNIVAPKMLFLRLAYAVFLIGQLSAALLAVSASR